MNNQLDENTIQIMADAITKAIAYKENGGKVDLDNPVAGKTGEMKSIFQFLPSTWENYAGEILGDKKAPLNKDNETYVVNEKVKRWLRSGKTAKQIASMWNAGTGEPDAHDGTFKVTTKTHKAGDPSKGILKNSGVAYDVPKYAQDVEDYSKQFFQEKMNAQSVPKQAATKIADSSPVDHPSNPVGNFIKQLIPKGLSMDSLLGVKKASAMEQPPQTNSQTMPLLGSKPPVEPPVQTETSANMKGLLGSSGN